MDLKPIHKYKFLKSIGSGKFGEVYKGENRETGEQVAIKLETMRHMSIKILKHETTILNYLYTNKCKQIPIIYWFGKYENKTGLVMPYYETSLDKYAKYVMDQGFSKKQPELLEEFLERSMDQCLNILRDIHRHYVVHRDIKPQNFMVQNGKIILIDFGMATFYVDENKDHIKAGVEKPNILGTPKYVSINIHNGEEYTRRDDMISLGYMFLYLLTGSLPWDKHRSLFISHEFEPTNVLHPYNQYLKYEKEWDQFSNTIENMATTMFMCRLRIFFHNMYGLGFDQIPDYNV